MDSNLLLPGSLDHLFALLEEEQTCVLHKVRGVPAGVLHGIRGPGEFLRHYVRRVWIGVLQAPEGVSSVIMIELIYV